MQYSLLHISQTEATLQAIALSPSPIQSSHVRHPADRRAPDGLPQPDRRGAAEPARGQRHHRGAAGRPLVHEALRLHGAGLHGLGRLHGPGQLGDRHRRRGAVRLHAALRRHALEPDGDPPAGALGAPRHRHRARPRPGLPRLLSAPGRLRPLVHLRARDHRLRPRRGDRHGDRAQPALRHSPHVGRDHHRARRLPGALPDEPRLPRARGLHRRRSSSSSSSASPSRSPPPRRPSRR